MPAEITIDRLTSANDHDIDALSEVLIDCVRGGASVGFLEPISMARAVAFWREVAGSAARGERVVLVARDTAGDIIGTVQVIWARAENQPHRADVAKMLVHRRARRQGVGALLIAAAERSARDAGRTLLVLDTVTGSDAGRLYVRAGWLRSGDIPDYALWPDGTPCATTVYFRSLRG